MHIFNLEAKPWILTMVWSSPLSRGKIRTHQTQRAKTERRRLSHIWKVVTNPVFISINWIVRWRQVAVLQYFCQLASSLRPVAKYHRLAKLQRRPGLPTDSSNKVQWQMAKVSHNCNLFRNNLKEFGLSCMATRDLEMLCLTICISRTVRCELRWVRRGGTTVVGVGNERRFD